MDSDAVRSRSALVQRIQSFFFEAMVEGWAGGGKKTEIADMPGYKAISYRDRDFFLLDCYCVNPGSRKSAGTTTIWLGDEPVWFMSYNGFYAVNAIPFLKRALWRTYEAQKFFGGRGPIAFQEGPYVYLNRPRPNDFEEFAGREEIIHTGIPGPLLGFHEYRGSIMF